mgnify:CR=1 FL=1
MSYRIRLFREDDADALATIAVRAIELIGPRAYSREQVEAWAARHGDDRYFIERVRDGQTVFLAADEGDRPCAYMLLEIPEADGCHLDHLYCDPDHTRCGLAEQLLARAEEFAREAGAPRLYTEASELARPVFERAGYRLDHRRDFAIEHAGRHVPIHNYAMEKALA